MDQISAEKTKVSERLARLDADRATVATQLTDLETCRACTDARGQEAARYETHIGCRRRSKDAYCYSRPTRAAAKSSHENRIAVRLLLRELAGQLSREDGLSIILHRDTPRSRRRKSLVGPAFALTMPAHGVFLLYQKGRVSRIFQVLPLKLHAT